MVAGSKARSEGSEGSKARLERSEGSKARSERSEGSKAKRRLKGVLERGGVRKHTTLDGWEKVVEKYKKIFFLLPNSRGRPTQVKISLRWKFSKSDFKLGHFKVAFHLMDLLIDFSYEVCKTRCPMSQSLDDMLAYLPDLKYRPPFLLNLLVCLIDDDLLSLIWITFIV